MTRYHWISNTTGEIVRSFGDVARTAIIDLFVFHTLNISWTYNRKGY